MYERRFKKFKQYHRRFYSTTIYQYPYVPGFPSDCIHGNWVTEALLSKWCWWSSSSFTSTSSFVIFVNSWLWLRTREVVPLIRTSSFVFGFVNHVLNIRMMERWWVFGSPFVFRYSNPVRSTVTGYRYDLNIHRRCVVFYKREGICRHRHVSHQRLAARSTYSTVANDWSEWNLSRFGRSVFAMPAWAGMRHAPSVRRSTVL